MEVEELPSPPLYVIWIVSSATFFSFLINRSKTFKQIAIQCYEYNMIAHVLLIMYMAFVGRGEASLFEESPRRAVNLGAVPMTMVLFAWVRWSRKHSSSSLMFNIPVLFICIGWFTVWPDFLTTQQYKMPTICVMLWVFMFWCEHVAALAVVCLKNKTLLLSNNNNT